MSEKLNGNANGAGGNGVTKETVVNAQTPTEKGVVDEVALLIEQGEARPVGLGDIEKGLTALWQAASKVKADEQHKAVTRACVANLVICVDGDDQLARATETVAQITYSFPCRAIVLVRKPEVETSSTTASISAHCQLPSGGNRVCCEQITIVGTGKAADGLWSMVLPLLVADLPVVLWWPGDPCVNENLFDRLLETADRLIVDSRVFVNPGATFSRLSQLSQQDNSAAFGDLSWSRLNPWRSALAGFFDSPDFLPYLSRIDSMEISYEAPNDNNHPNFSEALLLVAWLAHQLGWQPAFGLQNRGKEASFILNQAGVPLTITLHGHNDRVDEQGGLTEVKITARRPAENEEDFHTAIFSITLNEAYDHAVTSIVLDNGTPAIKNVLFAKPERTDLLRENLALVHRDRVYEAALELAGHFNSPK